MDIRNWCSSSSDNDSSNSSRSVIQLGTCRSANMKGRMLWMKLKKEKKRLLLLRQSSMSSNDPHTYSQNFDKGTALDDPDYLSRSFSARLADPSSRLHVKKFVL